MAVCSIFDCVGVERYELVCKPDDLYGCDAIMYGEEHALIDACRVHGWVRDIDSWSSLSIDELVRVFNDASIDIANMDAVTKADGFLPDLLLSLVRIMCASITLNTGLTVDSINLTRGGESCVSLQVTMGNMYSYGPSHKAEPTPFLRVAVDNSNEDNH